MIDCQRQQLKLLPSVQESGLRVACKSRIGTWQTEEEGGVTAEIPYNPGSRADGNRKKRGSRRSLPTRYAAVRCLVRARA